LRLPLIPPALLTAEQKALYDDMRKGIATNFNAFKVECEDGVLIRGPIRVRIDDAERFQRAGART